MTMPTDEIRLEATARCIELVSRDSAWEPTVTQAREELRLVLEVLRAAEALSTVEVNEDRCGMLTVMDAEKFRDACESMGSALAALRSV